MAQTAEALVVDASVAVKWHLADEEHAEPAAELLRRFAVGAVQLVAPAHLRYEVASAITVATRGRAPRLSVPSGQEAIGEFLSLDLVLVEQPELILAAYSLVHQHAISYYDALYLALAQQLDIPLVTADRKFYQQTSQLPGVIWLGDYPRT